MKKYIRLVLWATAIIFLVCLSTLIACNLMIVNNANGKTFYEIDSINPSDTGLLLGTTPQTRKKDKLLLHVSHRCDRTTL